MDEQIGCTHPLYHIYAITQLSFQAQTATFLVRCNHCRKTTSIQIDILETLDDQIPTATWE